MLPLSESKNARWDGSRLGNTAVGTGAGTGVGELKSPQEIITNTPIVPRTGTTNTVSNTTIRAERGAKQAMIGPTANDLFCARNLLGLVVPKEGTSRIPGNNRTDTVPKETTSRITDINALRIIFAKKKGVLFQEYRM